MYAVLQALAHAPELCFGWILLPSSFFFTLPLNTKANILHQMVPHHLVQAAVEGPQQLASPEDQARNTPPDQASSSRDAIKFCALCELEEYLQPVNALSMKDRPVAPENVVHGFIDQVAPWFQPNPYVTLVFVTVTVKTTFFAAHHLRTPHDDSGALFPCGTHSFSCP